MRCSTLVGSTGATCDPEKEHLPPMDLNQTSWYTAHGESGGLGVITYI